MKKKLLYIFLAFFIVSCVNKNSEKEILIDFKPNENVISFKIAENLNDEYAAKSISKILDKELNTKTDTIKYTQNEIYISYIEALTGCVKYNGDILIKNDSLLLKLMPINNIACTEIEIRRIVYRIKNPKNINYKIRKFRK